MFPGTVTDSPLTTNSGAASPIAPPEAGGAPPDELLAKSRIELLEPLTTAAVGLTFWAAGFPALHWSKFVTSMEYSNAIPSGPSGGGRIISLFIVSRLV